MNAALKQAANLMKEHAVTLKWIVVVLEFCGADADAAPTSRSSIGANTTC